MKNKLNPNKKIYFASDFHLGDHISGNKEREIKIISWLEDIKRDAKCIYLLGDIFDFWFEYKKVIPKGFVRILGKFAELTDSGIEINFVVGNHDLWAKDYLYNECGINIHHKQLEFSINEKYFFIAHGDNLGNSKRSLKILKFIFKNKFCQWMFSKIHPDLSFKIAHKWSKFSRKNGENPNYLGPNNEHLQIFCKNHSEKNPHINYYMMGHRHLPLMVKISKNVTYCNTGDWITNFSYFEFNGKEIKIKYYK